MFNSDMRVVEFTSYGPAAEVLTLVSDAAPPIASPTQVLIQVLAVSVNPVDCAIRSGYGKEVFRFKGQVGSDLFPQRLGRDAAGVVRAVGGAVTRFKPGDRVYCAPARATMADLIAVEASEVAHMPAMLTFVEAASIPFVALTAWSALVGQVGLTETSTRGKHVLITRGAGGVGSFAIQLLKAWGAYVVSTCSTRNVDYVRQLGADLVIDYTKQSVPDVVNDIDVALDGSFDMENAVLASLKTNADASYITIVSPKIRLIDEFGLEEGARRAEEQLAVCVRAQAELGRHYYWGFMRPDGAALSAVTKFIDAGAVRPIVDKIFPLNEIVLAHEYCENGRARGKIVIDLR
jgi:NADPH:quinone reductase-like Zn-dependent oxidoreductase